MIAYDNWRASRACDGISTCPLLCFNIYLEFFSTLCVILSNDFGSGRV